MDSQLDILMNIRMDLTRIENNTNDLEHSNFEESEESDASESDSSTGEDSDSETSDIDSICSQESDISDLEDANDTFSSKYDPPLRYKEHSISHFCEDIRNIGKYRFLSCCFYH